MGWRTRNLIKETRMFNGKRYSLLGIQSVSLKSEAQKIAKDLRAKGNLVRVTPGYQIWVRKK